MDECKRVLNEILQETFNDILSIEQSSMKNEHFSDISITEVHTIEAIGINEAKPMTKVAEELKITVGTLTTAINNLVKKGYVERMSIKEDRRVVLIGLTKKGKIVYRAHEKFHENMIKEIITGISDEEREILIIALKKLNGFFKKAYNLEDKKA